MPPDASQKPNLRSNKTPKPNLRSNKTLKKGSRGQMGEPGSWKPSIRAKARPSPSRLSPLEPSDSGLSLWAWDDIAGCRDKPPPDNTPLAGQGRAGMGVSLQGKT